MPDRVIPHVGDWVAGDKLKRFEYQALKLDNTPYDLTGHTVQLLLRSRDDRSHKLDTAGVVDAPATDGIMACEELGFKLTLGAGRKRETYDGRFRMTRTADSKITYTEPFSVSVVALPV